MLEELFYADPLVLKDHANNQAVIVASDVEDRQIAYHVRRRERVSDLREAVPLGLNGSIEPNLQRGLRIRVFLRSCEKPAFADDVHNSKPAKREYVRKHFASKSSAATYSGRSASQASGTRRY
jgi:hypothetical protein